MYGARVYTGDDCAGTQEVEMEMGGWVPAGDGRHNEDRTHRTEVGRELVALCAHGR